MPSRLRNTSECEESHNLKPCVALGVHRHTKQKLAGTASSRRKMARHPAGLPPILLLLLLTIQLLFLLVPLMSIEAWGIRKD